MIMTIVSKAIYGVADAALAAYLLVFAYPAAYSDIAGFFLLGRSAMTFLGLRLSQNTVPFSLFYGGADVLIALFMILNATALGWQSGPVGAGLLVRGALTLLGIYIS